MVKTLRSLLDDFVMYNEAHSRRAALASSNPLALQMYALLDGLAGVAGVAPPLPLAFTAHIGSVLAAPGPVLMQQQQQQQQQQPAELGSPGQTAAEPAGGQAQGHTPGRLARRKCSPSRVKRRRLEFVGDLGGGDPAEAYHHAQGHGASPDLGAPFQNLGGHMDLLNMPLDDDGLMDLLGDNNLQVRRLRGARGGGGLGARAERPERLSAALDTQHARPPPPSRPHGDVARARAPGELPPPEA
jgi:hypothetical protein